MVATLEIVCMPYSLLRFAVLYYLKILLPKVQMFQYNPIGGLSEINYLILEAVKSHTAKVSISFSG